MSWHGHGRRCLTKLKSEGCQSLVTLGVHRGAVCGICHAVCAPGTAGDVCAACCREQGPEQAPGAGGARDPLAGQQPPRHGAGSTCPLTGDGCPAALDPPHDDRVTSASLSAGALDVAGVALCQRWRVTWGLWDPPLGRCGVVVVPARRPVPLHTPEH